MNISHTREGRRFTWIYTILENGEGLQGDRSYLKMEKVYMDISHTREGRRFTWIYPILEKGKGLHGYIPY